MNNSYQNWPNDFLDENGVHGLFVEDWILGGHCFQVNRLRNLLEDLIGRFFHHLTHDHNVHNNQLELMTQSTHTTQLQRIYQFEVLHLHVCCFLYVDVFLFVNFKCSTQCVWGSFTKQQLMQLCHIAWVPESLHVDERVVSVLSLLADCRSADFSGL